MFLTRRILSSAGSYKSVRVTKFGGPEVLKVESVNEIPLAEDEVQVKLEAIGVNPVDTYIRTGTYSFQPSLPFTPGMEGAGIIEKLGKKVSKWRVNDRVYICGTKTGTYAEKTVCGASQLQKLPDTVTFEQGAAVYISYATAFIALVHRARIRAGETVLIHGASGGTGLAALQIAKALGAVVIGTASSSEGLKIIEQLGGKAFNHKTECYQDILENYGCPDVILEMLSNVNLERDISTIIGDRGRIVVIGSRGTVTINPRGLMSKNASVIGMHLLRSSEEEMKEAFAFINGGLENKILNPIISTFRFSLSSVMEAHKHIIERPPGTIGKVIMIPKE